MTSNAATRMFTYHAAEQGLGEDDEARYYYTAMSNTNTTNTNSNFVNEPYGGILSTEVDNILHQQVQ